MTYRKVNYEDVDQVSSAMHFLSDPLETEQVGVTVARCDPGWNSRPHDHADNDHEEVYVLIEGEATVVIDDEPIEMETGDAVWISPESTRQIKNGNQESAFVLVSAPSIGDENGDDGEWLLTGFAG
ncbi:cupin domain-containing protein [Salinadaptatus halalkaliphilus]|uniref:Cupin domain-containing protein n=1 Tax=Salinadaptatus halalkaliphilus TaxID=2419781 RepID=A0A4S3TGQ7_9EURY|nr:cupin domain-containing protein [Salinadaptatus halalkaliphilus]THE63032.1 cupin domain-containing protein [Salinadaptatus halalkaliphilus]